MQNLSIKQSSYNNLLTSGIFFFSPHFKSKRSVTHLEAGIAQQFHSSQCRQWGSLSLQRETDPMSCCCHWGAGSGSHPFRALRMLWLSVVSVLWETQLQRCRKAQILAGILACFTATLPAAHVLRNVHSNHVSICREPARASFLVFFFYLPTVDWKLRFPTCQALAQQQAIAWRQEISELERFLAWATWKVKLDTQNGLFLS